MTTRKDLPGVTSIVHALGLEPACYDRLLDFFHSPALDLNKLTPAWCALAFRFNSGILRINLKPVLPQRSIKVAKAGRKMPGVKKLHQESDSNTKPEYIFGHSCQAVAVLTQALSSVFALPLACRLHEGAVFSNRDHRTLLDKMILLLDSLDLNEPFYFVAAAYHRHIQLGLIAQGLLQILSATKPTLIWQSFGSWIRTVRPGLAPSEQVVAIALRNTLPEFLASAANPSILVKFIRDRLDLSRAEGTSLAA